MSLKRLVCIVLPGCFLALFLAACTAEGASSVTPPPPATPTVQGVTPDAQPTLQASATPSLQPSATATFPPAPTPQLCSPLQGFTLEQLLEAVVNPFQPPRPGSDDPHHGVDFAELASGSRIARAGATVQAVLPGRVATRLNDRFPYGNALILETPLEDLPPTWLAKLDLPQPGPTQPPLPALTCPEAGERDWDATRRSLYLLYAHLEQASSLHPGDPVSCGQALGTVGDSGNALNPHLHFEARVGPAGARLESLAHYHASATLEEMANYCLWRVSDLFQMIDPLLLLAAGSE